MWVAHHIINKKKRQKLMIWYMGYTHHQIKGKEKENDDTACGLHTASSNERGNKKKKKKKKKKKNTASSWQWWQTLGRQP